MASSRDKLVIGTRGSKLALWQSEYIKGLVEEITGLPVELKIIKTTGDKILDVPLAKVGGKGLFTKELEVELLAGTVDLCVHSMKDVASQKDGYNYVEAARFLYGLDGEQHKERASLIRSLLGRGEKAASKKEMGDSIGV